MSGTQPAPGECALACTPTSIAEIDPNKETFTLGELEDAASTILDTLGADTCEYSQSADSGDIFDSGSVSTKVKSWVASGELKVQGPRYIEGATSNTTSIGCENIAVAAQSFIQTQKAITEVLACSCTLLDTSIITNNTISINAENSTIDCGYFEISQNTTLNVVVANQQTQETTAKIKEMTENSLNTIMDTLIDSRTELGATPSANKSVQSVTDTIQSESFASTINKNITAMYTAINVGQTVSINLSNTVWRGDRCTITQNILLDLVVTNMLSNTLTNLLESTTVTDVLTTLDTELKEVKTGLAALTKAKNELFDYPFGEDSGFSYWSLVLIAFCCCCCVPVMSCVLCVAFPVVGNAAKGTSVNQANPGASKAINELSSLKSLSPDNIQKLSPSAQKLVRGADLSKVNPLDVNLSTILRQGGRGVVPGKEASKKWPWVVGIGMVLVICLSLSLVAYFDYKKNKDDADAFYEEGLADLKVDLGYTEDEELPEEYNYY